ncbi:Hypothetical protein HVR_LOCUS351 [uncultured virus]|nr:Hypothetical protein HVR_LOCUS351 [uncultured virus]
MCDIRCSSISLFINDTSYWHINGNFSPDYVLGVISIGLALIGYSGYFIVESSNKELVLSQLRDLDKLGGYISYENKTTNDALQCNGDCQFRYLKPDDGITAAWVFDHNEKDGPRWNLIMTDCVVDFLNGFDSICKAFGVSMWDYILGEPIESEGGVGSWSFWLDDVFNIKNGPRNNK